MFAADQFSACKPAETAVFYLDIQFDATDKSGTAFGFGADNCRTIKAMLVMERVPSRCEVNNNQRGCTGFCVAVNGNDPSCPGFCSVHDDMRYSSSSLRLANWMC